MTPSKRRNLVRPATLGILSAGLLLQSAQAITWYQWTSASGGNDHWYGITDNAGTWHDARTEALSSYADSQTDLVTINSTDEQTFLNSLFSNGGLLWIGLTDESNEGAWNVWVTGEVVTFTNWAPDEPNDYQVVGGEDYAVMNWLNGGWNDVSGDPNYPNFGIVERVDPVTPPASGVPDGGASMTLFGLGLLGLVVTRYRPKR